MRRLHLLGAVALGAVSYAMPALAQGSSDEIIVTGSSIRGTPENAALPVDVISADELERQGSPSTLELIKSLSVSTGVLGETNQFETRSQGNEGSGTINLRGLGAARTLVLINGRRMTPNPFSGAVDTNIIPTDAIGRVEILKDGAAAIYGSDAIGGVVNFITRTNFEGLEIGGSYRFVDGSDGGDYTGRMIWGWSNDRTNIFLSAGYQHRGELSVLDRDFSNAPFTVNPQAGWSTTSSVTGIRPLLPDGADADTNYDFGTTFLDPACAALGGIVAATSCRFQFLDYDNLVETEDRYQFYGQIDTDLGSGIDLHLEAFYSRTDIPEFKTSPGYGGIQAPTANLTGPNVPAGGYFVPINHPALTNPDTTRTVIGNLLPGNAVGAYLNTLSFRTFSFGGNPLFPSRSGTGSRDYDAYRVSGRLNGEVGGVNWEAALSYSQETGNRTTYDAMVSRLQLAMRGFGSLASDPNGCTAAETANFTTNAGNSALGCHWFNPFSSSIPVNVISGEVNNVTITGGSPAILNSADLVRWFYQPVITKSTQSLAVADLTLSGDTFLELPGGVMQWAAGGQFRRENFTSNNNDLGNARVTPCVDTPYFGNTSCVPQGPFHFLGSALNRDIEADVYALFGELQIPILDSLSVQIAARYEDYGGEVGSTFDPKISARWQALDWLAFRGSAGSTFRGPPQTALGDRLGTSFEFVPAAGRYIAVNNFGNPGLEPESADTRSFGVLFEAGNFNLSVDYWSFDFENPIVNQSATQMAAILFAGTNCTNPAFATLIANHFAFNGACGAANLSSITVQAQNGAAVYTDGIDIMANYRIDDILGGEINIGATFTHVYDYETEAQTVDGILVSPAFEAVGRLNSGTTAFSLPQLKGNIYADYSWGGGDHNLRATVNYIDSYVDQRVLAPAAQPIDEWVSLDLDYRAFLPWDTTLAVSVDNVTDEDPPFARLNLSYDPGVHSALGRTIRVGLNKRF